MAIPFKFLNKTDGIVPTSLDYKKPLVVGEDLYVGDSSNKPTTLISNKNKISSFTPSLAQPLNICFVTQTEYDSLSSSSLLNAQTLYLIK